MQTYLSAQHAEAVKNDVMTLAGTIGERHYLLPHKLADAVAYITSRFTTQIGEPTHHTYTYNGQTFDNIVAEIPGTTHPEDIIVIGAHYDTAYGAPGANDNASGVAAVVALATLATVGTQPARTLRFVAFANEEPPFFWGPGMGSRVYAEHCKEQGDKIIAMLTPETLGYYSDEPGSQKYPWPMQVLYPSQGNFLGFIGTFSARKLVRRCLRVFRAYGEMPCAGAALPPVYPRILASDHASFWRCGYRSSVMITDTAMYRYQYYHTAHDTPDKLCYERMGKAINGIAHIVDDIATYGM